MKLSSISCIAAALAAIAGSTIAAPAPLCARAFERVNSFEHGLDVYPCESWVAVIERDLDGEPVDNLFTRALHLTSYQTAHKNVANLLEGSETLNREAARVAVDPETRRSHEAHVTTLGHLKTLHAEAAAEGSQYNPDLHSQITPHKHCAISAAHNAIGTIKQARLGEQFATTAWFGGG